MLYKSNFLTLETIVYSWYLLDKYWLVGPSGRFTHRYVILDCLGHVRIWVELPVQRRLCPIFVNSVGLPDIH